MPDVSLVIPFLNEEDNLNDLIEQLNEYAKEQSFSIEVVFVDDGSTDSSVQIIRDMNIKHFSAKLIRLSRNFGSFAAMRAGVTSATGQYTMFFGADLQEPFSLVDTAYRTAHEGDFDIVVMRKERAAVSHVERMFSVLYSYLVKKFAIKDYPIGNISNLLFSAKVRKSLCDNVESNSSLYMQLMDMGYKRTIIDTQILAREKGKSKWTTGKRINLFLDSFVSFSVSPIRFISLTGIIMFFVGFVYFVWIVIATLTGVTLPEGYPTIISVLLLGFGLTNLSLGIIAEYIWRTLVAARNRPVFIIDSVEEL